MEKQTSFIFTPKIVYIIEKINFTINFYFKLNLYKYTIKQTQKKSFSIGRLYLKHFIHDWLKVYILNL